MDVVEGWLYIYVISGLHELSAVSCSTQTTMASSQLQNHTPQGSNGMTLCLSLNCRAIAHAALKYKTGYLTISRYNSNTDKWRNVHIARKSVEKLIEESGKLLEALRNSGEYQVRLTKKQFFMILKFQKCGREPLYYASILHPLEEQESITSETPCNHIKTINMTLDEFEKLHESLPKLLEVMKTPREQSGNEQHAEDENSEVVTGYRWAMLDMGRRSNAIFLTKHTCEKNALAYLESLPDELKKTEADTKFNITTLDVPLPSKIEIVEHVTYSEILRRTGLSMADLCIEPPAYEVVKTAISQLKKHEIVHIVSSVCAMLKHTRLYLISDIYDIFLYMGGIEKVTNSIMKHVVSMSGKLFARLLDACYREVVNGEGSFSFPSTEVSPINDSQTEPIEVCDD